MNKAILIGNVGKDPELRYTTAGKAVVSLSLATSERWKDRDGEKQERTEWHNLVAWEKTAELINQYVRKGSKLAVCGKITTRSWDDKDGNKRYTTEIVVAEVEFLSPKQDRDDWGGDSAPAATAASPSNEAPQENLPF